MPAQSRPEDLLPLTPAVFHILLALTDGQKHGYAIMQEVAAMTQGDVEMGPGTLYGTIKRMLSPELIEETPAPPDDDDPRRRYYRLTPFGDTVVRAEAKRLDLLVVAARQRQLLTGGARMNREYESVITLSEQVYAWLVRLYPAAHQRDYAELMIFTFGEMCRDACERDGLAGVARLWLRMGGDIANSIATEYLDQQEYPVMTALPAKIDRFVIKQHLGHGSAADVYLAHDPQTGQDVVLKCPNDNAEIAPGWLKYEASLLEQFRHPAIPEMIASAPDAEQPFLAMEYIRGKSLLQMLETTTGFLPEHQVIQWALSVCDALEYLHGRGTLFRDLKPVNIMVTAEDKVYLLDFGIAEARAKNEPYLRVGTVGYSPPEQYVGQCDVRSDVYALGATLYHVLTRRDPRGEQAAFLFHFHRPRDLNPGISVALEQVILKATEHKPADRFATITDMKATLSACLSLQPDTRGLRNHA